MPVKWASCVWVLSALKVKWKFVNTLESGKCRTDFIADGGSFSYSVAAHVAQSAIESGSIFDILSGMGFVRFLQPEHAHIRNKEPHRHQKARNSCSSNKHGNPVRLRRAMMLRQ